MNIPAIVAPARLKSVAMLCVFLSMTIGRLKAGAALTSVGSGTFFGLAMLLAFPIATARRFTMPFPLRARWSGPATG